MMDIAWVVELTDTGAARSALHSALVNLSAVPSLIARWGVVALLLVATVTALLRPA